MCSKAYRTPKHCTEVYNTVEIHSYEVIQQRYVVLCCIAVKTEQGSTFFAG